MRQKIIAGNWKMNLRFQEGIELSKDIANHLSSNNIEVILGAPFPFLYELVKQNLSESHISIAAQNCHHEERGAYTGEISIDMLDSIGVPYVILGHSERRQYYGEYDVLIAKKIDLALSRKIKPIYCCGESVEIRERGEHMSHVLGQLSTALFHLEAEQIQDVVIAYEPVWAIGTGHTATPLQAQEMHESIRNLLAERYGRQVAESISILYGGSVKPANANEIFKMQDVDGALVGGASLSAESFNNIIDVMESLTQD